MPAGAADRGDIDMTPAAAVDMDNGEVKRLTIGNIPDCDEGAERLRTWNIQTDCDGNVVVPLVPADFAPRVITLANQDDILATATSSYLAFRIDDGYALIDGVVVAPVIPRTSMFAISCFIEGTGNGLIRINYNVEWTGTGTWSNYEEIPLSPDYPIDKILVPSRRSYWIQYYALTNTTDLTLQIILYPSPK